MLIKLRTAILKKKISQDGQIVEGTLFRRNLTIPKPSLLKLIWDALHVLQPATA